HVRCGITIEQCRVAIEVACEVHVTFEPQAGDELPQRLARGPLAGDDEQRAGHGLTHLVERVDEKDDVLFVRHAADVSDQRPLEWQARSSAEAVAVPWPEAVRRQSRR